MSTYTVTNPQFMTQHNISKQQIRVENRETRIKLFPAESVGIFDMLPTEQRRNRGSITSIAKRFSPLLNVQTVSTDHTVILSGPSQA